MSNLILFEGVDRAGKSSVSKYLANLLGAEWQHYSKPDKDPTEYFKPAIELAKTKLVIADRHCLGERVYAKVKKEPSQWTLEAYEAMLSEMEQMKSIIVILHEDHKLLQKRFVEENETYITWEEGKKVQELFLKEGRRIAKEYPGMLVFTYRPSTNCIRKLGNRI